MSKLIRPVKRVDDVIVIGERHRESGSRSMVFEAWNEVTDEESVGGVCVEADPSLRYRDDGGGGVGGALVRAEANNIPRFYLDESVDDIIEAFGGRYSAYSYLKGLKKRFPPQDDGRVNVDVCSEIRSEIKEKYGEEAFHLVCENREEKMARRAQWVSNEVDGVVLLVVGSGHFYPIISLLENSCEPLSVSDERVRVCDRDMRGPWGVLIDDCIDGLRELSVIAYDYIKKFRNEDSMSKM